MSASRVRRACPEDAAAIAGVHVGAWRAAYRGLVPDEVLDGLSIEQRQHIWRDVLARDDMTSFTLVAQRDRDVVGFCSVAAPSRDDDARATTCEVAAIYVEPDSWRAGVGGELLAGALRELGSGDWDEVTLWVLAENRAARAFYEQLGFEPDGAEALHERSGQKEVRLRASLLR